MITGIVLLKTLTEARQKLGYHYESAAFKLSESPLYLYIGSNDSGISNDPLHICRQLKMKSFEEATHEIQALFEIGIVPDFIIVDQSLNEMRFTDFVLWLHSHRWSLSIPVLYNEAALRKSELIRLGQLGLADGILNVEDFCNFSGPTILNNN